MLFIIKTINKDFTKNTHTWGGCKVFTVLCSLGKLADYALIN